MREGLEGPPSGTIRSIEEKAILKKKVDAQKALSGITNMPCIFFSIEIKYWVEPTLHLKLGIVNGTKTAIDEFIFKNLELDVIEVTNCRVHVHTAEEKVAATEEGWLQFLDNSLDVQNLVAYVRGIDKLLSLKHNQRLLNTQRAGAPPMTPAQGRAYATLSSSDIWPYRAGTATRAESDVQIAQYTARSNELQRLKQEAKGELSAAKQELDKAREDQKYTPIRNSVDDVFSSFGIDMSMSYTMQWNGHACHRMLEHSSQVGERIEEIWAAAVDSKQLDDANAAALKVKCSSFMSKMTDTWTVFEYVEQMLGSFEFQDEATFVRFDRACKAIGLLHRALGLSVTPKLHALECYLPATFRFYGGRIAHFDESPGERIHKVVNTLGRLHANTKGYVQKTDACASTLDRDRLPTVIDLTSAIKEDHIRPQSVATAIKKARIEQVRVVTAAEKLAALDILLDHIFRIHGHLVLG
jgi:hypothetical protein